MSVKKKAAPQKKEPPESLTAPMFPGYESGAPAKPRRYKRIEQPIWTENKAQFIRHYLRFFVQITKHGAYIDGFAGPQSFEHLDAWCAALVLSSEPRWLRRFFLFESSPRGFKALEDLAVAESGARDRRGKKVNRNIELYRGDFNANVDKILCDEKIPQKEATFCLLDQRTFECQWETVKKLAAFNITRPDSRECIAQAPRNSHRRVCK